jgi:methylenetetrahydrofolate dehydrogenase (NADP+)/methenyltetrahydrofolate cyclohydrolase
MEDRLMELLNIKEYVKQEKEKLRAAAPKRIKLGIIDATEQGDSANHLYIKNKCKDFAEIGWDCEIYPVTENSVKPAINRAIVGDCTSIIVQLPTRKGIDFRPDMIPSSLDCDGVTMGSLVIPATPKGIVDYLRACGFPFSRKTAVVLGRSDIVGKPLAKQLADLDMTVSLCHSKTRLEDRVYLLKNADLVICAIGKAKNVKRSECPQAVVVDVGINRDENGKLCGDFEEDGGLSTPVPGGVGLLTRLALMKNCYVLGKTLE